MPKRIVKRQRECWNYDEHSSNLERYDEALVEQKWVTIESIFVPSEYDKAQLLAALKYLHDNRTIDTDFIAVNYLTHLYQNPDKIIVKASKNDL